MNANCHFRCYEARCSTYQKEVNSVTIIPHDEIPKSTVSEILASSTIPNKFRTVVQVVGFSPPSFQNFTRPFCVQCNRCVPWSGEEKIVCDSCSDSVQQFVYMFQLSVHDETGNMDVIVFDEDGDKFFYGIPPTNLYTNNCSLEAISRKMSQLLDTNSWIDCCIKSYFPPQKQAPKYRIFDTTVL